MTQPNIVMTRIDERLIHGQGQMWVKALGCNTVIVANDDVCNDKMQQTLMTTVVPKSIFVRFYDVQKVIDIIGKANPKQSIFIIIKDVKDAYRLVKGGVPIKELNIGNIHAAPNKESISRFINLSDEEKKMLRELHDEFGLTFNTKTTPNGDDGGKEVNILNYI
ncbi:PTS sugar transporter subunit IIB [Helcococcus ovis]|uniref:PTS mannose/fructose/sorbose transporter subunit IIB n=1 Tax=Helcococcus ovis TaxID=72026 RepID=A0A4R9C294_9FIRM|nr:PTS sugar transporter subunit IIB [Helcococcus ovis]TFF64759.1 PTS mannose/fructose/sorbose transporter subunit IIB [Helcococcus ovis]TFF66628.1 PTS mannose/fructose/sorbose transporter subunit IIB [Helcococcus ovis]TFF68003.1 PTS mannose/fructose/sorbose transporter subunit IIB [Helcococcus ovis]WNZ01136.1 PTS sugar transporter subunit IIB [Helcococcus ovis]